MFRDDPSLEEDVDDVDDERESAEGWKEANGEPSVL